MSSGTSSCGIPRETSSVSREPMISATSLDPDRAEYGAEPMPGYRFCARYFRNVAPCCPQIL
jgi:hypothetical protein